MIRTLEPDILSVMTLTSIQAKHQNPEELAVVETIKELCKKYALPAFTHRIVIEQGVIPHSHPVLTLNTRNQDERAVLATLLHEQFHWHATSHPRYEDSVAYLKTKYAEESGYEGQSENSYWEHIIVCFNTRSFLMTILSQEDIAWVYDQWQPYPGIEKLVEERYEEIRAELERFGIAYVLSE